MEGVHLSAIANTADEPLLQSMRSDLEAAWEEHAAKKSKLSSPEPSPGKVGVHIVCRGLEERGVGNACLAGCENSQGAGKSGEKL